MVHGEQTMNYELIPMNFFKKNIFFVLLLLLGICLRFINLNWGAPIYFHPDERNIASIVRMPLQFPDILTKGTFAYGNFLVIVGSILRVCTSPFLVLLGIAGTFARSIIIL